FRHAYYARVRGVERASDRDQTLTITSDAAPGIRMSELLARTEERRIPLDINAALCLIRQLVPAVAMLHENARDVSHGALGLERLPMGLRGWLTRALQLDPKQSFASAIEARAELDKVIGDSDYIASPTNLEGYLARVGSMDRPAPRLASGGPSPLAAVVPPP